MGAYCSVAQLTARFASTVEAAYATDNESAGVISSTVAAECIGTAEGIIESHLSKRYAVPLSAISLADTSVAQLMLGITLDLAEYGVLSRSPEVGQAIKDKRDYWLAWLILASNGEVLIPGAVTIPGPSTTVGAYWSTWDRTYADTDVRDVSRASAGAI